MNIYIMQIMQILSITIHKSISQLTTNTATNEAI